MPDEMSVPLFLQDSPLLSPFASQEVNVSRTLATELWQEGRYQELCRLLQDDLEQAEREGNSWGLFDASNDLACLYRTLGDHDAAAHFQRQAVASFSQVNPGGIRQSPLLQANMACDALLAGRLDPAEYWLWRSLLGELGTGNDLGAAADWANLGIVALLQDQWETAKDRFWEAVRLHRLHKDLFGLAHDLFHLAQIFEVEGDWNRASNLFARAADHFQEIGNSACHHEATRRTQLAAARAAVLTFDPGVN